MTDQPRPMRRRTTAVAAVAMIATLLGSTACSSSKGKTGGQSTDATATSAAPTSQAKAVDTSGPAPQKLTIEGLDYSYKITGAPHAGLVEIDFTNHGDEAHEVGLSRVKDGVTLAQVKTALLSRAADAEQKAKALQVAPDTLITAPAIVAGHRGEKTVVPLVPGHYIVTCFLPGPHGMPHAAMGMLGEFTVLAAASSVAAAPKTDGTVELTDHAITLPPAFTRGGTFEVRNTGTKVHDFSVAKLAGKPLGALFQCVGAGFAKGTPIDSCPGALEGGVTAVHPGESAYVIVALPKGSYGYVSTQGNGADFQAGLNGTFSVN